MDLLRVGSEPVGMRCPYCQEDVMTQANYKNTTKTHLIATVLAVFFWWLCCCIIPYFVKRWKNVEHYCPSCHRFLGVYTNSTTLHFENKCTDSVSLLIKFLEIKMKN